MKGNLSLRGKRVFEAFTTLGWKLMRVDNGRARRAALREANKDISRAINPLYPQVEIKIVGRGNDAKAYINGRLVVGNSYC